MLISVIVDAVALILSMSPAFAQKVITPSQPPVPSAGEARSQNQQIPATQNQPSPEHERGTLESPIIVEMVNPPNGDTIAAEIKKNRDDQTAENWRAFIFNCLLVAVGVLQGGALIYTASVTFKAARSADRAARFFKSAERAHIGGGFGGRVDDGVFMAINNYGKTPAFVRRISIDIRPNDATLPEMPEYPDGIEPGFLIPPHTPGFQVRQMRVPWDGNPGQVFYGRIWFTDTIDSTEIRFSSFILNTETWLGVLDRPRYWEST